MTGQQRTITDALKNRTDQRIEWLLNGVYTVLNGKDRGLAYIRSLNNCEDNDDKENLWRWLYE